MEGMWARTAAIERIKLCGSNKVVALLDIVSNSDAENAQVNIYDLLKEMRNDLFPEREK